MATIAITITSDAYENGLDVSSEESGQTLRAWLRDNYGVPGPEVLDQLKRQGYVVNATVDGVDWFA